MNYQDRSVELLRDVMNVNYYVDYLKAALTKHTMTIDGVFSRSYSVSRLYLMWSTFWYMLPDTSSIRTGPFFKLCDMCSEFEEHDDV